MISLNIHDSSLKIIDVVNNNSFENITNTKHLIKIENFVESFEFESKINKNIKELNYVSFLDFNKELKVFQIVSTVNNIKKGTVKVSCESMSIQLINKVFEEYSAKKPMNIEEYFNMFLVDSIFKVRSNESEGNVRTLKWESEGSALNRILSVANSFDVELKFTAEYSNNQIKHINIDILNRIGKDTNKTLDINTYNIVNFEKTTDVKDLRTALIPKGAYLTADVEEKDYLNLIKDSDFSNIPSENWRTYKIYKGFVPLVETYIENYKEPKATSENKTGLYFKQKSRISSNEYYLQELDLEPNETYTLSFKNPTPNSHTLYYGDIFIINDLTTFENGGQFSTAILDSTFSGDIYTKTFTTVANRRYAIGFRIRGLNTNEAYIKLYDLQVVKGAYSKTNIPAWSEHISKKPNKTSDYVNIADIEYDDGYFKTVKGENKILAYKSNEKYRRNYKLINQGYLDAVYSYETDNPTELFNRALNRLKVLSEPSVSYETTIDYLSNVLDAKKISLGDYINISDVTSELYLKARIVEIEINYLDLGNSRVSLGNYYHTSTNFAKSFNDLRNQVAKHQVSIASKDKILVINTDTTDVFMNNKINAVLTAKLMQGDLDISSQYPLTKFNWFKYDENNVLDQNWSYQNQGTTNVKLDNTEKINDFATYVCKIADTDFKAEFKISNIKTTIASETEPLNPKQGEQWLDISKNPAILYVFTANGWLNISEILLTDEQLENIKTDVENNLSDILNGKENAIFKQPIAPENPANNTVWIDTSKIPNTAYRFDIEINNWVKMSVTEMEDIILENGETLATVIVKIQQKITDESILDTVIKSKDFEDVLKPLVNQDDLLGYMSEEDYQLLSDEMKWSLMNEINENLENNKQILMTQIEQLAEQIRLSVSNGGGVNLLRNSLGMNKDKFWTKSNNANPIFTYVDQEIKNLGFYSGFEVRGEPYKYVTLSQKVPALPRVKYTLSFYAKGLKISNNAVFLQEIGNRTTTIYTQKETFNAGYTKYTYTFTTNADTKYLQLNLDFRDLSSSFFVTGLMLNLGTELEWQQHSTEFYNTNTIIDLNGISVLSSTNEIYTQITNEAFEIYRAVNGIVRKVLTVNSDITEIDRLKINKDIQFGNITMKRLESNSNKGFGFFNKPIV